MGALRESIVRSYKEVDIPSSSKYHRSSINLHPETWLYGLPLRMPKNTDARLATASSLKNKMRIADKLEGTLTTMERTC